MRMIRAPQAHAIEKGWRKVDVGVIDTGIDAAHVDFIRNGVSNVDISRGASFAGSPDVATDNGFHGTHVAGIIAARANGHGILGVAPNVTLVPIKVCDASGYCYASSVAQGITYAGDIKLDVINMSLFADDEPPLGSTQFKCNSDPEQAAFRLMVERAIEYARSGGCHRELRHGPPPPGRDAAGCHRPGLRCGPSRGRWRDRHSGARSGRTQELVLLVWHEPR
jgi:hypothetical protein